MDQTGTSTKNGSDYIIGFMDSLGLLAKGFQLIDLNIPITPDPQLIRWVPEFYSVNPSLSFSITGAGNFDKLKQHTIENLQHHHPFEINCSVGLNILQDHHLIIENITQIYEEELETHDLLQNIRDQSYYLKIADQNVFLIAQTDVGFYYGLCTLSQLIHANQGQWVVQQCEIFDYPHYALRGMTDQVCHGQVPTVETLKKWIRFLSRNKQNLLGLNLEDIMPLQDFPQIGKGRGKYTIDEIQDLRTYAEQYYVELMPGFQALGHLENFLYDSHLREYAEFPGANCLDLSNPQSLPLIKGWYKEIAGAFSPKFMHIELDEAYDFGLGASKSHVQSHGKGRVLIDYIHQIFQFLHQELGLEICMYHDTLLSCGKEAIHALQSLSDLLPRLNIIYWNYTHHISTKKLLPLQNLGIKITMCPSIANWSKAFPYMQHAEKNMVLMAQQGRKISAYGYVNSTWGDFNNENLHENNYYGIAFGANLAWNTPVKFEPINKLQFVRAFTRDFFGMHNGHLLWEALEMLSSTNRGGAWGYPFYDKLWEHPLKGKSAYKLKDAKQDLKKLALAREDLKGLHHAIQFNTDLFEYLRYAIDISQFCAEKAILSHQLFSYWKRTENIDYRLLNGIKVSISSLASLWERYQALWKGCAKPEGLERVERNYVSLQKEMQRILDFGEQRIPMRKIFLSAAWIVPPNLKILHAPVYYRKRFFLSEKDLAELESATLQVIAHTYGQVWVNSVYKGEIISRYYLSPVVYDNSVQLFDFQNNLQSGWNEILVKCVDFAGSLPTVNVYGELTKKVPMLKSDSGSIPMLPIKSDFTWASLVSVKRTDPKVLYHPESDVSYPQLPTVADSSPDSVWHPTKEIGDPPELMGEIRLPEFSSKHPSWISRRFGLRGYTESMILMHTHSSRIAKFIARFFH